MKVCGLLLALLGINQAHAQALDPTRQFLDNLVAPLDKTQVPTGFLAEYAVPLVPLDVFNGTLTDSSRTNPDGFRFIYATVYSAWLGSGNNPLPSPLELNARLDTASAVSTAIPVMVQHIDYATVRPDAFDAGLLAFQNDQMLDAAGRLQSPYLHQTLFAAAPAIDYSPTGDVTFIFPRTLDIERSIGSGQTLSVDFGDGRGYINTAWDQLVTAHYATAGTWRVKVRVTYSNRGVMFEGHGKAKKSPGQRTAPPASTFTSYESQFDMRVASPSEAVASRSVVKRTNTAPDLLIPIGNPFGNYGAMVTIHYASGHTSLINPLIVVEGYDKNRIAPAVQEKNYDLAEFLSGISTNPAFNFKDALANGANGGTGGQYDIVFIDFYNGTGNILINAAIFEQVLNEVQQRKVGTAQNVVMGMSMGGLIARYKLADMTKAGRDPHTRLLILQDSPQRGANVPLGIQALTRQMLFDLPVSMPFSAPLNTGDLSSTIRQGNLLLDEPGTRQMLVHTATNANGGFAPNTFIAGTYHNMIDGDTAPGMAYTIVAASQGSQCGQGLLAPYTELISVSGDAGISPMPWISRGALSAEAVVNALPDNGQSNRVSHLEFKIRIRLFRFIRLTIPLLNRSYSCPSNLLAVDGVAGSTEDIVTGGVKINDDFTSWPIPALLGLSIVSANWHVAVAPQFCFLPTASALDIPLTSQVLQSTFSNGIGMPVQPQLHAFIAQESFNQSFNGTRYNKAHLAFTPRNTEWMYDLMEGRPFASSYCASECNLYPVVPITGPDIICTNSSATFSVTPPRGGVIDWTASPAGLVTFTTPTAGATSVTVVPVSSSTGEVTLTAQIGNNGCYGTTATRQVSVGQGFLQINNNQSIETCAIPDAEFTLTHASGAQGPFIWQVSDGYIYSGQGTEQIIVHGLPFQNYRLNVSVSSPASCTGSAPLEAVYSQDYVTQQGGLPCVAYRSTKVQAAPTASLYPNPARETVDVHIDGATSVAPITVRLFDAYGKLRTEQSSMGEATVRLKTDQFPAGLYFVHILRGKEVLSRQQLRIEK